MIDAQELAKLEYEALQAEKRDRMNARLQVWSLFLGLVSAFGLASLQSGVTGVIVALYPFLAYCLAGYVSHSEAILDQVKKYVKEFEMMHQYQGYECFNQIHRLKRKSGGHIHALRDALVLTQGVATLVVSVKLFSTVSLIGTIIVTCVEGAMIVMTWKRLNDK